jgi:hypothetical protein
MELRKVEPVLYSGDINEHLPIEDWAFRKNIEQEIPHYIIDDKGTDTVIVSFGGMGIHLDGESKYALVSTLEKENISTIFLRDQSNVWYFNGVRGLSTDVQSTIVGIKQLLSKVQHKKTFFFGVSSGGFAAILYGTLCEADLVVAVNPQTLLLKGIECFAHGNLYKLKWCNQNEMRYTDLAAIQVSDKTNIEIYYGKDEPVDIFHSGRMSGIKNVTLFPEQGNHATAAPMLRNNKRLRKILQLQDDL